MSKIKAKTKRAAAKRFKITGSGKIKFKKAGLIHKLSKKSRDKKRPKRNDGIVNRCDMGLVLACLPNR